MSDGAGGRNNLTGNPRCLCGTVYRDWCSQCLRRYGEHRRPVRELTPQQQMEELVMMVRPIAIPVSFRWRRYVVLAEAITPGTVPSFHDFLNMESSVETALAKKQGRAKMFEWPPAGEARAQRRRQRVVTQVLGVVTPDDEGER